MYDTENALRENVISGKPCSENLDDLLREKIGQAITEMKREKGEGIDNMPVEMIQNLGEKRKVELVNTVIVSLQRSQVQ